MHRFVSNKNQSNEWQVVAAVAEAAELTVTPLLALGQRGGRRRGGRFLHTRVGIKHGDKANGHDLKLGCREGQIEPKRSSEGSRCETRHLRQARHSGNVSGKRERERGRERERKSTTGHATNDSNTIMPLKQTAADTHGGVFNRASVHVTLVAVSGRAWRRSKGWGGRESGEWL